MVESAILCDHGSVSAFPSCNAIPRSKRHWQKSTNRLNKVREKDPRLEPENIGIENFIIDLFASGFIQVQE
jgi:hypothetical protein